MATRWEYGQPQNLKYLEYTSDNGQCLNMRDLRSLWWWRSKSWSSGLWHRVAMLQYTDVSEGHAASVVVSYHITTWCHNTKGHDSVQRKW